VKIIKFIILVGITFSVDGCGLEKQFDYRPVTNEDIEFVLKESAERNLSAQSIEIVVNEEESGFLLVKHRLSDAIHYGAILLPKGESLSNVPAMIVELLSNLVFRDLNQAAAWFDPVTSIPSLNFTPVMTFAR